jgi:tripartite-type tricarboxylate transporter receptor subunit TctC
VKLPRREFLYLAAGASALPAVSRIALAQAYPARPVHIIVGLPAGGTPDLFARLIGEWLSERLGQSFVIENRPGAATNIATELVVRAVPDGYTLVRSSATLAIICNSSAVPLRPLAERTSSDVRVTSALPR